jgi:hypothetical protein
MDDRQEQLSWEQRVGRPVAIASFAAAALLIAALVYSSSKLNAQTDTTIEGLRLIDDRKTDVLITTVLQGLSTALLAAPLWFLFEATRFRRPEIPKLARYLAIGGPVLTGVLQVVRQIQVADVAAKLDANLKASPDAPFSTDAANEFAKDQLGAGSLQIVGSIGLAAGLALAFAFILISLNAMRAGLLSRFMGILGIIVGVLFVVPLLGPVPIVEVFWVAALGLLFLGKWPQGGRGPAWETAEAIPWPTAADRQAEMVAARAEREEAEGYDDEPEALPSAGTADGGDPQNADEHPRSKKRKRKRR